VLQKVHKELPPNSKQHLKPVHLKKPQEVLEVVLAAVQVGEKVPGYKET
jgi:hypothetical protein